MKLVEVRVRKFRNILDSGSVPIQPDITCLVGKNESGKTALLHALYRLHPDRPNAEFSVAHQYPAWFEKRDRLKGEALEKLRPILAAFELEDHDVSVLEEVFGPGILRSDRVVVARDYGGQIWYSLEIDDAAFVRHLLSAVQLPKETDERRSRISSIDGLRHFIHDLRTGRVSGRELGSMRREIADDLESQLNASLGGRKLLDAVRFALEPLIPKFLYFSAYSSLPYAVDIRRIMSADPATLDDDELTALALLKLASADETYLQNGDYERRTRELEYVANAITDDVLKYWSQTPLLRVKPDITQRIEQTLEGDTVLKEELKIRIWDERHSLSLPFNEHSTGFRWFFSFLAAFSAYEHSAEPLVILLDEPALGLHARAQRDFLRFLEERLAPRCQVIYTTHSPFMVQPGRLDRVRLVEDRGKELGAMVSAEVTSADPDTLFPLQGALGFDMARHLFTGPHKLVVERTCDFTYLTVLSDYLRQLPGRTALDERWTIVPVGGADLVPAFVALVGNQVDVTVLINARKQGHRMLSALTTQGILQVNRVISIGQVVGARFGHMEDVFEPNDYLALYNRAFDKNWKFNDLDGGGTIVYRIARKEEISSFDHGRPAEELLRHREEIMAQLSAETLDRFEALFKVLNATLPSNTFQIETDAGVA